jgi:prolyl-tRNA editing enzyme YbaK/EbsC (Cys-tRNA(Pro) deacylase)
MAAAAEHIARQQQAKVVMVSSKKGPAMAVLPADRKLDLGKAQENIHEPVALLGDAEFAPVFAVYGSHLGRSGICSGKLLRVVNHSCFERANSREKSS